MKKLDYLVYCILLLIVLALSAQVAEAKKPQTPGNSQPSAPSTAPATTTAAPTQTVKEIVIINNTQTATAQQSGLDWQMIGTVLAIIGGIVGWLISRKVRGKTAKYMTEIDKAYRDYNKNANKCEAELANLREKIEEDFKKGKINDQALSILDARIDKYAKELRSDIVDKKGAIPEELKKNIKHMLSDGKITKEEYGHFKEILGKTQMGARDKEEIKGLMKRWKEEDRR